MTRIDPKISTVDPKTSEKNEQIQDNAVSTDSTKFIKVDDKDPWKAMTESSSDVSALADAMHDAEKYAGRSLKDAIIDSLFICDPTFDDKSAMDHTLHHIPDLHEEIFKDNPRLQDNMKPIVKRYEALKSTLKELRENALNALKRSLNADEIRSNQIYIKRVNRDLLTVEKQLEEAHYYLHLENLREIAARELAEAEDD